MNVYYIPRPAHLSIVTACCCFACGVCQAALDPSDEVEIDAARHAASLLAVGRVECVINSIERPPQGAVAQSFRSRGLRVKSETSESQTVVDLSFDYREGPPGLLNSWTIYEDDEYRYVRGTTFSASQHWIQGRSEISLVNREAVNKEPPSRVLAGDIRSIGPSSIDVFMLGSVSFDDAWDSMKERAVAVRKGGNGVFEVECRSEDRRYRVIYKLDPSIGLRVTAVDMFAGESEKPMKQVETVWGEFEGETVPIQQTVRYGLTEYGVTFKWHSVGRDLPEATFTLDGLKLKERTLIVDARRDEPILETIVNSEVVDVSAALAAGPTNHLSRTMLYLTGATIIALVLALVYRRITFSRV